MVLAEWPSEVEPLQVAERVGRAAVPPEPPVAAALRRHQAIPGVVCSQQGRVPPAGALLLPGERQVLGVAR